jgi:hypothetical protein
MPWNGSDFKFFPFGCCQNNINHTDFFNFIVEYDYVGGATNSDADELIAYVMKLKIEVLCGLKKGNF